MAVGASRRHSRPPSWRAGQYTTADGTAMQPMHGLLSLRGRGLCRIDAIGFCCLPLHARAKRRDQAPLATTLAHFQSSSPFNSHLPFGGSPRAHLCYNGPRCAPGQDLQVSWLISHSVGDCAGAAWRIHRASHRTANRARPIGLPARIPLPSTLNLTLPPSDPICSMAGKVTGSRAAFSGARLTAKNVSDERSQFGLPVVHSG